MAVFLELLPDRLDDGIAHLLVTAVQLLGERHAGIIPCLINVGREELDGPANAFLVGFLDRLADSIPDLVCYFIGCPSMGCSRSDAAVVIKIVHDRSRDAAHHAMEYLAELR